MKFMMIGHLIVITMFVMRSQQVNFNCSHAIDVLKLGPENWKTAITAGTEYTDPYFKIDGSSYNLFYDMDSTLYASSPSASYSIGTSANQLNMARITDIDSSAVLWNADSGPIWSDVRSNDVLLDSHFMASLAAISRRGN